MDVHQLREMLPAAADTSKWMAVIKTERLWSKPRVAIFDHWVLYRKEKGDRDRIGTYLLY